jgi:diguanylate cyclase
MANVISRIAQRVARPAPRPAPVLQAPAHSENPERLDAALALAREVLHSVEQFVISTPDLDTSRFLHRVRGAAAGLTPQADPATIVLYREWAKQSLGAFGGLQQRYVGEREDEMWRLLNTYVQNSSLGQSRSEDLLRQLQQSHERMKQAVALPDLREAREQIEAELTETRKLVQQKEQEDKERIAALTRQVTQLEKALAAVRGQAKYDVLTGIFHRGAFQDRFREFIENATPCCVAVIDVDNFKTINDTLGHPVGDRILAVVGESLKRITRSTDVCARFGGDEFCFLTPGRNTEQVVQRLAGAVARRHVRLELEERHIQVLLSMSVGIAASVPGDGTDTLLDRADQALLTAKREGKGGIRIAGAPGA